MHSDDINVSLVVQLVSAQFPQWANLSIKPVELSGVDNRTFRLGEEMLVRLPSAEAYTAQVEKEHQWLPRLAPLLPIPIPIPVAMGVPSNVYPWHWSIYRWLDGENAAIERIANLEEFATSLAQFLGALQQIDTVGGPPPGMHNFFRGASLTVYDTETRHTIAALDKEIDADTATAVWETALKASWHGSPVWFHGDVSAGNLLVKQGQLSAVIDFGCSGVGDPACDMTIAWTLLSGKSRDVFRRVLPVDEATWARDRGWALWKALITLSEHINTNPLEAGKARQVIDEVLTDYKQC
jgi:aminoglycoside phosphotransferase (APT) family kinase protein